MTSSYVLNADADARLYNDVNKQLNDKETEDLIHGKTGMNQAITVLYFWLVLNNFKIVLQKTVFYLFESRTIW